MKIHRVFFFKLRQSNNLGIAISLSKFGLKIISWAILSEIVATYYIVLVYIYIYLIIFSYIFSGYFGLKGLYLYVPLKRFLAHFELGMRRTLIWFSGLIFYIKIEAFTLCLVCVLPTHCYNSSTYWKQE